MVCFNLLAGFFCLISELPKPTIYGKMNSVYAFVGGFHGQII